MKPSKRPARRPARMRVTVLRECPVSVVARPSSELGPDGSTRVLPLTSASITDIGTPVSQDRPLFWPGAKCFRRENGPDPVSFCLALLPAAPGEEGHRVLDGDPQCRRYHPTKAFGSFALKMMPPMPVTRARRVRATMPGGEPSGY